MYSDDLLERLLSEEEIPEDLIHDVVRLAVLQQQLTPVLMGTAYRNKGIQPLLTQWFATALAFGFASHGDCSNGETLPLSASRRSPWWPWPSRSSRIRSAP